MNAGQLSRSSFGAVKEIPFGSFRRRSARSWREPELGELIQEGDGARGQKAVYLLTRVGEEENDEELDKPDDRRMVDGIWPDELEKTRNRVQVGEKLKVMLLADTRTKGEVRTVRRTVRVISKHRYLVRTSDGSSSTYAELAMYYRGKILDRR